MSTQETAALIESVNQMTATVAGKMGQIDQRMTNAESDLNTWKATTSYVQQYYVAAADGYAESDKNTGEYHLIQLYRVKNSTSALNPWIHFGFTGINNVGSATFCSLAQTHAYYTGQSAMFAKRGSGDIKFFTDRKAVYDAPVYIAIKNTSWNNANISAYIASYMALNVESLGSVNLATWQGDNPTVEEIELIDIAAAVV
ncbi:hypothetical protein K0H59_05215 [Shewanella sp. FJAT-51649]|uniref:hypothetical protein n=1 Tax=Shewanella sp. FJAT-51649 TaxID=2864210 RepID=UPI001C654C04|nr:hypothetical protein [Shewanella sp. FJAT-51649]QYJ72457.1 hypothetical protein K0H59_05215 [Shewanella sp. FJAT-51649]